jgi:hypothetical protein
MDSFQGDERSKAVVSRVFHSLPSGNVGRAAD